MKKIENGFGFEILRVPGAVRSRVVVRLANTLALASTCAVAIAGRLSKAELTVGITVVVIVTTKAGHGKSGQIRSSQSHQVRVGQSSHVRSDQVHSLIQQVADQLMSHHEPIT